MIITINSTEYSEEEEEEEDFILILKSSHHSQMTLIRVVFKFEDKFKLTS